MLKIEGGKKFKNQVKFTALKLAEKKIFFKTSDDFVNT
jgi:hypothetical protein